MLAWYILVFFLSIWSLAGPSAILDPPLIAISMFLPFCSEGPNMAIKSLYTQCSLLQCDPSSQPLTFRYAAHAPNKPRLDVRRWFFRQQISTDCCLTVPDPATSTRYSFHSSTDKPNSWSNKRYRSDWLVVGRSRRWNPPWEAILYCLCC